MFYTPKHCCECGEKIQRGKWKLLTIRRFCEICESEFGVHDWMFRGMVGIGVLCAAFGVGSFLKKSDKPLNVTTTPIVSVASNKNQNVQSSQVAASTGVQDSAPRQTTEANAISSNTQAVAALSQKAAQTKQALQGSGQNSASEAVYFCGAQTKKGMPCTRRVKVAGRCWQHTGQPALLPPEKLIASQ